MAEMQYINAYGESLELDPAAHASDTNKYGLGDNDNYGHVKLTDTPVYTDDVDSGTAVTPKGVSQAFTDKGLGTIASGELLIGDTDNKVTTRRVNNGTLVAGGTAIPTEGAVKSALTGLIKVSVSGSTLVFSPV